MKKNYSEQMYAYYMENGYRPGVIYDNKILKMLDAYEVELEEEEAAIQFFIKKCGAPILPFKATKESNLELQKYNKNIGRLDTLLRKTPKLKKYFVKIKIYQFNNMLDTISRSKTIDDEIRENRMIAASTSSGTVNGPVDLTGSEGLASYASEMGEYYNHGRQDRLLPHDNILRRGNL